MRRRYLCQLCLGMILLIAILYYVGGAGFYPNLRPSVSERYLEEKETVRVQGRVGGKSEKDGTLTLELKEVIFNDRLVSDERILVYPEAGDLRLVPDIGAVTAVSGKIRFYQEPRNPGNFNQKAYYQRENIHAFLSDAVPVDVKEVYKTEEGPAARAADMLRERLWRLKSKAVQVIEDGMGPENGGMLCAMLLGERGLMEPELKELYQKSGIGHLYAISGLVVSFFGLGVYRLFRRTGLPVWSCAFLGSVFLVLYVLLTGAGVSAERAVIMFLVRMGAEVSGRVYDGLTALAVAAIVILLQNPLELWNAAFLLSFGALIGIYAVMPRLREGCDRRRESEESAKGRPRRKGTGLWTAVSVNVTLLPLLLYFYYEVAVYSVIWNAVVLFLAPAIFGTGLAGAVMGLVGGVLKAGAGIAFWVAGLGLRCYEMGSRLCLELPGNRWVTGQPAVWQVVIYYLCLFAALAVFGRRTDRGKKGRKWSAAAVILVLTAGAVTLTWPRNRRREAEIVMLDVGQGDAFFLRSPGGDTCLIDGGSSTVSKVGQYRLEPFLKSQGVGTLDEVFVSHGDKDHMNGIEELLVRQKVGVRIQNLVLPPEEVWDETLGKLAKTAEKHGTRVLIMGRGEQISAGGIELTCLWPGADYPGEPGNGASMVLSLTCGELDMLFTGDMEKEAEPPFDEWVKEKQEQGELPRSWEVLKVGHHGSKNATSQELLETVGPRWAFVSAGQGNSYGHPHREVIKRLANWGCTLYNTKEQGAVRIVTDGENCRINLPMQKRRNTVY